MAIYKEVHTGTVTEQEEVGILEELPFCHSAAAVLCSCSVPVLVPLSLWPVWVESRKATCRGLCVCVCVCAGVCAAQHRTVPHVSYTGIRTGERGPLPRAGGFVPTVSSNPAGMRRKLGTAIRGLTWQLESWNLAGKSSRRVAKVDVPDGLDWQTGRL